MDESEKHIIDDCRRGKSSAQLKLYNLYAQPMFAACYRIIGNKSDAEEAMQDSFMKVFTHLDQYHDIQSFGALLHRVAVHTAVDYVRRNSIDFISTDNHETMIENIADTDEDSIDEESLQLSVAKVKQSMQQLSDGFRTILSLYLFEGYDIDEIASILKIKPVSVRTQYLRAKRKLVELMTN